MKDRILPIGLKGNEINERMKELMGIAPINENKKTSAVELTKIGPDGNVYAIVRENHEYYIKTTTKKTNLVTEDFSYIGGLMNKKSEAYPTYAKAIKQLNLKFNSLNEAYGKSGQVNVFKNDNLLSEGLYEQGENTITVKRMSGGPSGVDITGIPSIDEKTYPFTMLVIKNVDGKNMARIALDDKNRFRSVDDTGFNVTTFEPTENSKQWFETLEKGEKMIAEYDKPAMRSFKKQYGDEEGKSIYYATANKQDRDPETFEKNEDTINEEDFGDIEIISIEEKEHGYTSVYIISIISHGRRQAFYIVAKDNAFKTDENDEIIGVYNVIDEFSVLHVQYMPFDLKRFLVNNLVNMQ
jgi:hypothetical protein